MKNISLKIGQLFYGFSGATILQLVLTLKKFWSMERDILELRDRLNRADTDFKDVIRDLKDELKEIRDDVKLLLKNQKSE